MISSWTWFMILRFWFLTPVLCFAFEGTFTCLEPIVIFELMGRENLSSAFGISLFFGGISTVLSPPLAGYVNNFTNCLSSLCWINFCYYCMKQCYWLFSVVKYATAQFLVQSVLNLSSLKVSKLFLFDPVSEVECTPVPLWHNPWRIQLKRSAIL